MFRGEIDLEKLHRKVRDTPDCSILIYMDSNVFSAKVRMTGDDDNREMSTTELVKWIGPNEPICIHQFVSADNEHVSGTDICTKCKTIRARPSVKESISESE